MAKLSFENPQNSASDQTSSVTEYSEIWTAQYGNHHQQYAVGVENWMFNCSEFQLI